MSLLLFFAGVGTAALRRGVTVQRGGGFGGGYGYDPGFDGSGTKPYRRPDELPDNLRDVLIDAFGLRPKVAKPVRAIVGPRPMLPADAQRIMAQLAAADEQAIQRRVAAEMAADEADVEVLLLGDGL